METKPTKQGYMRAYTSTWLDKPTFKLMPIDKDCPFLDGIFIPDDKILVLMSKKSTQQYKYIEKLNDNGDPVYVKTNGKNPLMKRQRVLVDVQYDYTLTNIDEIKKFVSEYAMDDESFDFSKYLE